MSNVPVTELVNKPVPGIQTTLTYPFIFSKNWTLLQYRTRHQFKVPDPPYNLLSFWWSIGPGFISLVSRTPVTFVFFMVDPYNPAPEPGPVRICIPFLGFSLNPPLPSTHPRIRLGQSIFKGQFPSVHKPLEMSAFYGILIGIPFH